MSAAGHEYYPDIGIPRAKLKVRIQYKQSEKVTAMQGCYTGIENIVPAPVLSSEFSYLSPTLTLWVDTKFSFLLSASFYS